MNRTTLLFLLCLLTLQSHAGGRLSRPVIFDTDRQAEASEASAPHSTKSKKEKKNKQKEADEEPEHKWQRLPQEEQQELTHYLQDFVRERGSNQMLLGLRGDAVSERIAFLHDKYGTKFFLVVRQSCAHLVEPRVLAFTIGGRYGSVSHPQPFMKMVEAYDSTLLLMSRDSLPAETSLRKVCPADRIIPLLRSIAWGQFPVTGLYPWQTEPYLSGCGAVALAQVMFFYRHPDAARGTCSYDTQDGHHVDVSLEGIPIRWNKMKDHYSRTDRDTAAIAGLVKMCGLALRSSYGPKGTSTLMRYYRPALTEHFAYADSARFIHKGTEGELVEQVRCEVRAGRPCILCDNNHIFVCDGIFDEFLHFNLGWSGVSNGWFRTIVPGEPLSGATLIHSAIVGIQPKK